MASGGAPNPSRRKREAVYLAIQIVGGLGTAALMGYLLYGGTMESRLTYLLAFGLGFINPLWAFYALALLGPLCLLDQGKGHILAVMEVLPLGMIAGELWRLRRGRPPLGDGLEDTRRLGNVPPLRAGPWPGLLAGLFLILLASSIVGWQLVIFQQYGTPPSVPGWRERLSTAIYLSATHPEWSIKSLWNWGSGIAVALILARRATPVAIARFLKLGAVGLAVACVFGLLDHFGAIALTHVRMENPDPLQLGRMQGLAGHPGWFAQWIVLFWPGIFLWWEDGRRKRNAILLAVAAVVAVSLVLAAARAAWLAVGFTAAAAIVYTVRRDPSKRRPIMIAGAAAAAVCLVVGIAAGEAIIDRMGHLLRAQDRANYYISTLFLLREYPLGVGLGLHSTFYDWIITPFYRWAQHDHVTAHSLWLHTLAENGPVVPLVLAGVALLAALDIRRGWKRAARQDRRILLAAVLALLGILIVSAAQYILYIRVVELTVWGLAGCTIAWARRVGFRREDDPGAWWSPRLLLALGLAAVFAASFQSRRIYTHTFPPYMERNWEDRTLQFWTGGEWWTPVNPDIDTIRFSLYRGPLPGIVRIDWPDGTSETVHFAAEESRSFEFRQDPRPARWTERPPALRIRVRPHWVPAELLEGTQDRRRLGVYISGFRFESAIREEEGLPMLRY